jgi:hypothetical protein
LCHLWRKRDFACSPIGTTRAVWIYGKQKASAFALRGQTKKPLHEGAAFCVSVLGNLVLLKLPKSLIWLVGGTRIELVTPAV